MKKTLVSPSLLKSRFPGEDLKIYLGVGDEAVGSVLVKEDGEIQFPVYYVSKSLNDAETRYPVMDKVALALISSARRLRRYFQAHKIIVVTDLPLRSMLASTEHSSRLMKWSSEFDISYQPRSAVKEQALADFVADLTGNSREQLKKEFETKVWVLRVDVSSGKQRDGIGCVLESPSSMTVQQASRILFPVTNNQVEYEALLAGLEMAHSLGVRYLQAYTDSQVVARQYNGEYEVKEVILGKYLERVKVVAKQFDFFEYTSLLREENNEADYLSKYGAPIGFAKFGGSRSGYKIIYRSK